MSLGKGILLVGGTLAVASVLASSPVLSVAAPLFWWGTKTYKIGAGAVAGVGAAVLAGSSAGRITGTTGTALALQGIDDVSRSLINKLGNEEKPPTEKK